MSNRLQRAKSVDLYHYLSSQGYHPVNENSRRAYYFSPAREETHPSFMVSKIENRWYDWGDENGGGDIIDFLTWLDGCTTGEAIDKILGKERLQQYHRLGIPIIREKPIEVIGVLDNITNETLIEYLEGQRKIPIEIANRYCKQVTFRFATSMWATHYGIGMENDKGGWAVRSDWFRGAVSPAGVSTVVFKEGIECLLLEGFMDYLSYVVLYGEPEHTTFILNSLIFIPMMLDILHGYDMVHVWIDADAPADIQVDRLLSEGITITDHRGEFDGYKDLNEKLQTEFDL